MILPASVTLFSFTCDAPFSSIAKLSRKE